jgi:renalase
MALMPLAQGWQLQVETEAATPTAIMARTVILAMPAPQIHPLLIEAMAVMPALRSLIAPLDSVVFEAVITVLAGYAAGTPPTLGDLPEEVGAAGWMVFGHDRSVLRWVGLDSGKRPQGESPVVVLHSSAAFAEDHLEVADLHPVGQRLLNQAAASLGPWLSCPAWRQVHRWRYGLVKQPHPTKVLSTAAVPTLVGCGDWCGGSDVEAAIASGHGAANQIAQWLEVNS